MRTEVHKRGDKITVMGFIVNGPDDSNDYSFTIPSNRMWNIFINKDEVMSKDNIPVEKTLLRGEEFHFRAFVHSGPDKDNEYAVLYDRGTRRCIVHQSDIVSFIDEPGKETGEGAMKDSEKIDKLIDIIKFQEKLILEIQEAARFALASPHHVQKTVDTVVFRLQSLMSDLEKIEQS